MNNPCIQLNSRGRFDLKTLEGAFTIDDIVVPLSRTPRYCGHGPVDYNNAQHCVFVVDVLQKLAVEYKRKPPPPALLLATALHDAHEPLWGFGDITTPAKRLYPEVAEILKVHQQKVDARIAYYFGFSVSWFEHPHLHEADLMATTIEMRDMDMGQPDVGHPNPVEHIKLGDILDAELSATMLKTYITRFKELFDVTQKFNEHRTEK